MMGKRGRRGVAALVCVALVGCVGTGEAPPVRLEASRPRPRSTDTSSTPDLRLPTVALAQAPGEIPLVPVPPPPTSSRPSAPPSAPAAAKPTPPPVVTPSAPAPRVPAPPPVVAPDGSIPPSPTAPPHTARQLLDQAARRCATLDSYIARLTRREHHNGKAKPEEVIRFSFRKQPFSVYFKWLGKAGEGREVVYVQGRFDSKIHTRLATGDAPLMPAGTRLSLSPDSPLVRSASRHPITNAGIAHCVQSLTELLDANERGDRRLGTLTAVSPQRRPEYPQPVETLERVIPPGIEPELPRGGRRLICFDPQWQLPLLVATYDDRGTEVEYYHYDRLLTAVNLDDDDFNPDKLWAPARPGSAPARR